MKHTFYLLLLFLLFNTTKVLSQPVCMAPQGQVHTYFPSSPLTITKDMDNSGNATAGDSITFFVKYIRTFTPLPVECLCMSPMNSCVDSSNAIGPYLDDYDLILDKKFNLGQDYYQQNGGSNFYLYKPTSVSLYSLNIQANSRYIDNLPNYINGSSANLGIVRFLACYNVPAGGEIIYQYKGVLSTNIVPVFPPNPAISNFTLLDLNWNLDPNEKCVSLDGGGGGGAYSVIWGVPSILPIRFEYFNARKEGVGVVKLDWKSSDAGEVLEYKIERSQDGSNWQQVGQVNAGMLDIYSYTDNIGTLSGTLYYRIRAINQDGSSKYTEIRIVRVGDSGGKLSIYPTITGGMINVVSSMGLLQRVRVSDGSGRMIIDRVLTGTQSVQLDISKYAKGIYYVEAITAEERKVEKVLRN